MSRSTSALVSSQEYPERGYVYASNGMPTGYFNHASPYIARVLDLWKKAELTTTPTLTVTIIPTGISYDRYTTTFCLNEGYLIQKLYTSKLNKFYNIIDEEELESFFIQNINNSKLIQPLQEINNKLKEIFPNEEFLMNVDYNSVTDDEKELIITIKSTSNPKKTLESLDKFYDWYIIGMPEEIREKISFALDYL